MVDNVKADEMLLQTQEEVNESINKVNIAETRRMISSMSRQEKEEAIKCFPDDLVINQFLSKFQDYKSFAIDIVDRVNELKEKVGVDK